MSVTLNKYVTVVPIARSENKPVLYVARWHFIGDLVGDASGGVYTLQATFPAVGDMFSGRHMLWTIDNMAIWSTGGAIVITSKLFTIWINEPSTDGLGLQMLHADYSPSSYTMTMINSLPFKGCYFPFAHTPSAFSAEITPNTNLVHIWLSLIGYILDEDKLP